MSDAAWGDLVMTMEIEAALREVGVKIMKARNAGLFVDARIGMDQISLEVWRNADGHITGLDTDSFRTKRIRSAIIPL